MHERGLLNEAAPTGSFDTDRSLAAVEVQDREFANVAGQYREDF
jgi:hypothetical protein